MQAKNLFLGQRFKLCSFTYIYLGRIGNDYVAKMETRDSPFLHILHELQEVIPLDVTEKIGYGLVNFKNPENPYIYLDKGIYLSFSEAEQKCREINSRFDYQGNQLNFQPKLVKITII